MRIGKGRASLGKPINMRGLYHRMAAEIADPVVLIIDRNKENVRLFIRCMTCNRQHQSHQ